MTFRWSSQVPCEKFSLATFIPALISRSIIDGELVAGPMVHTIFVLRIGRLSSGPDSSKIIPLIRTNSTGRWAGAVCKLYGARKGTRTLGLQGHNLAL